MKSPPPAFTARPTLRFWGVLIAGFLWSLLLPAEVLKTTGMQDAIAERLSFDPAIDASEIKVSSSNGKVRLTGAVDNQLARQRASQQAATVRGVDTVENRLKVMGSGPRPSAQLEADVRDALATHPATRSLDLSVQLNEGVAKIIGRLNSLAEADLVKAVVIGVNGVQDLEDNLVVRVSLRVPDYEIQTQVEQAIHWDTRVRADRIRCSVKNGIVHLSGEVNSLHEKWQAVECASVVGVAQVEGDDLSVVPIEGPFEPTPPPSAEAIVGAIEQALIRDPLVSIADFSAQIQKGRVTLSGVTDSLFTANRAVTLARYTHGVREVRSALQVEPDGQSDAQLAETLRRGFSRDPYLAEAGITIAVDSGRVTLSGQVQSYFTALHAIDRATEIAGLCLIDNHVETHPQSPDNSPDETRREATALSSQHVTDSRIFSTIEEILWWSPFVDPSGMAIQVQSGVAVFRGRVASLAQAEAAIETAYIAGARDVINQLEIPVY